MQKFRFEIESNINVQAWKNPAFKKKLLSEPRAALKEMGMKNIPENVNIRIVEEKPNEWCITLHQAPPNAKNLSEEELKKIAAAWNCGSAGCHGH